MGKFIIEEKDYLQRKNGEENILLISKAKFDSFNEDILGLGKIETKSTLFSVAYQFFN
jgi:hypothetical protein